MPFIDLSTQSNQLQANANPAQLDAAQPIMPSVNPNPLPPVPEQAQNINQPYQANPVAQNQAYQVNQIQPLIPQPSQIPVSSLNSNHNLPDPVVIPLLNNSSQVNPQNVLAKNQDQAQVVPNNQIGAISNMQPMGQNQASYQPLPIPQSIPVAEQVNPDIINDIPVGELNSLNIPLDYTQPLAEVRSKNAVEMTIGDNDVKTFTGPALQSVTPINNFESPANSNSQSPSQSTQSNFNYQQAQSAQPLGLNPSEPIASLKVNSSGLMSLGDAKVLTADDLNSEYVDLLPATTELDELMSLAESKDASDIHFAAHYPITFRVDGQLLPITKPIDPDQAKQRALSLLNDLQKKTYEQEKEIDFSFTSKGDTRFRVNLFTERGNCAGALRLISKNIRTMQELELPDIFLDLIEEPHGLILLVGPTGSGKSTTLAAMLNHINLNRREHILTIEDPIEYIYPIAKSIVDQRELNADTMSWDIALKSALREDPNIVLVGEMRDLDTIASTITIAETGHLVFATLHTNSASQAIDRIIDVFPDGGKAQIRAQLANVITAVISQRLIPVQGGGRKAGLEVMLGTTAVRNAIRDAKTYQIDNIIQTSGDLGMITLEKSLVQMVKKGYITKEEAKGASVKPDEIESLMNRI